MAPRRGSTKRYWYRHPDGTLHKRCSVCGVDKSETQFPRDTNTTSRAGRASECCACHVVWSRATLTGDYTRLNALREAGRRSQPVPAELAVTPEFRYGWGAYPTPVHRGERVE